MSFGELLVLPVRHEKFCIVEAEKGKCRFSDMDDPLAGQRSQTVGGTETVHYQGLGSGEASKSKLNKAGFNAPA